MPQWSRCLKYGIGYCDGYEAVTKSEASQNKRVFRLQPNIVPKPALRGDPVVEVFGSQDEFTCFRTYCEEVAPRLSLSNQSMWQQLLLQAGQNYPFIRHAIIAMGALNRALQVVGMGIIQLRQRNYMEADVPKTDLSVRLSTFALEHYGKFLRGAKGQISMSTKEDEARKALITCILVVCIETMQYHHGNAIIHAQYGLRLMMEFTNRFVGPNQIDGLSSPVPSVIEDELVQQFQRLELQVMATYDARTPEDHFKLKKEGALTLQNMPGAFLSIEQAKLYLDLIMRRAHHLMGTSAAYRPSYDSHAGNTKRNPETNFTVPEMTYTTWADGVPDEYHIEQELYEAENRRWSKAFEPMFRMALANINHSKSIPILLMRIHSLNCTIRLGTQMASSELVFDKYLHQFEEVLKYSEILLNHPDGLRFFGSGYLNMDIGLIFPLMTAGLSCRDRYLRRKSIRLLTSRSWREGQWGSTGSAIIAIWLMEVEENGVEGDFIPEWARAKLTAMVADFDNRTLHLCCIRGTGENATYIQTNRSCDGTM
ncbi:hypothetical protein similar to C6 zinc finger domain-containing protein [Blumeria hordei DH14]|uniref:Uncharacterized protein n=1 Tax=Blumeria graminis f. sp. hordei (strain DH14) TaxID=546991 RepID=N1JIB0_BLUG1|nr:hypothetical protein similar to C6 zinc finger domain-containing protein [Blumeria hordei DH14]